MKVKSYLREVYAEMMYKVSWPTWKELQKSALVVMIASLLIALVILAMDLTFEHLMDWIYQMLY